MEQKEIKQSEPQPGDKVIIRIKEGKENEGIWLQRPEILANDKITLKLKSGYNIGIQKSKITEIKIIEKYIPKERLKEVVGHKLNLNKISILHTGGTIASQVDYHTGGVVAKFEPQEFLQLFPEISGLANIDSKLVFQMFSEDMEPEHWRILAEAVEKEYKDGTVGVIITQGTDTIHYTAAALSFMLQNLPIPVLIVGSQRSPDRGSSDAYLNIFHAVRFLVETDFAGVGICMHGSTDDEYSYVHLGVKARKMHTSRRDTFRSINATPLAKITKDKIEYLWKGYKKQSEVAGKFYVAGKFNKKIGLIKTHPCISQKEFLFFLENEYDGLIIEGTGLGHVPINTSDEFTSHHHELFRLLKKMAEEMVIVMCSQCLYGRVDMHVYSPGRLLLHAGIFNGSDMTPETAYIKLGWLLGNYSQNKAKELITKNIAGESAERIQINTF